MFGAILTTLAFLSCAFVDRLQLYFLTFSVLFGLGQAFLIQATFQILPHYFDKRLGLANGIMNFGGAIITILFIIVMSKSLEFLKLKYAFLILMGISILNIISAVTFKSTLQPQKSENRNEKVMKKIRDSFRIEVLKRGDMIIWCLASCITVFGYTIASVTIVSKTLVFEII